MRLSTDKCKNYNYHQIQQINTDIVCHSIHHIATLLGVVTDLQPSTPPFKKMRRIKQCCSFLIMEPEGMCRSRNTQLFQGLDTAGTHVAQGGNYWSCISTGIKNRHLASHL